MIKIRVAACIVALISFWSLSPVPGLTGGPEILQNPLDGLNYIWIPPGVFEMGCVEADPDCSFLETPRHEVDIHPGFWMGRSEVTAGAYARFAEATARPMPESPGFNRGWTDLQQPVVNVTWFDAVEFCLWAGGRLPTEAEWEYAARGGLTGGKYPWGNQLTHEFANYGPMSQQELEASDRGVWRDRWHEAAPVGSFPENGFGLLDMSGNVEEWTKDAFDPLYYERSPSVNPQGPVSGNQSWISRAVRGGSWRSISPQLLRSSFRYGKEAAAGDINRGFRCLLERPRR